MPPCENTRASNANALGLDLTERTITVTLSTEMAAYLRTVSEGAGQSIDDLVSERLEQFRQLWGAFS